MTVTIGHWLPDRNDWEIEGRLRVPLFKTEKRNYALREGFLPEPDLT